MLINYLAFIKMKIKRGDYLYYKLKGIMAEKQITQKMLADKLDISISTLNFKINGKSNFTLNEAIKISQILGVEIEKIFNI